MSKIYIIGAVTYATTNELNYFEIIEKHFKIRGYEVVNPYELCKEYNLTNRIDCLEFVLPELIKCTDVCIMETANKSYDSQTEINLVHNLRKHTLHYLSIIEIENIISNYYKGIYNDIIK